MQIDDDFGGESSRFLKNRENRNQFEMIERDSGAPQDVGYEKALSLIGFGKFQYIILFICGLANASDAIEILCVSFVLPTAECELKMSSADKGYLSAATFVGMMIGGYIWGALSDIYGRKHVLISALFFNAFFAILAGLAQTFGTLIVFRLFSGIGVGGSVPIVWSYFSEFIHKDIRGRMICCLATSWFFGNLLVIMIAYFVLTYMTTTLSLFNGYILINSWRVFMIACALPSLITGFIFFALPESAKYCLYNNKVGRGYKILCNVYSFNHKSRSGEDLEKKRLAFEFFSELQSSMKSNSSDDDEDYRESGDSSRDYLINSPPVTSSRLVNTINLCKTGTVNIIKKTVTVFQAPYTFKSLINMFIMFAVCFSYYGLWMWLPELYKRMNLYGGSPCHTGLPTNGSLPKNESSCYISNEVYVSSTYSALSNLPGNIFTILFVDSMGRNKITSLSLIVSGLSIFGIPFTKSESEGVLLTTIFGGIITISFNSFGCTSTEIYPTKLRSTALGVQYVAGRMGAILGNIVFGLAVDASCYIPLMSITTLLVLSGFLALKLPESKRMDIG